MQYVAGPWVGPEEARGCSIRPRTFTRYLTVQLASTLTGPSQKPALRLGAAPPRPITCKMGKPNQSTRTCPNPYPATSRSAQNMCHDQRRHSYNPSRRIFRTGRLGIAGRQCRLWGCSHSRYKVRCVKSHPSILAKLLSCQKP